MEGMYLEAQLMWRASRGTEARPRPTAFTALTQTMTSDRISLADDTAFVIFSCDWIWREIWTFSLPPTFWVAMFLHLEARLWQVLPRYLVKKGAFIGGATYENFMCQAFHLSFNILIYIRRIKTADLVQNLIDTILVTNHQSQQTIKR